MNRSLKALIRKTFGKNHTMKSQASVITLLACLAFVLVVMAYLFSLFRSYYHRNDDPYEYLPQNIVVVNAPDSWKDYAEERDLYFWAGLVDKETDAVFDVFTFSKWMKENDAFMTLVFPEDFDEKALELKVDEKPEVLTFVLTDRLEYVEMKDAFLEYEFEGGYYYYLADTLGVVLPSGEQPVIYTEAIRNNYQSERLHDRVSRMVAPLIYFVVIMYTCMLIGMNAIAGEKERGTFASLLMTPMSRGTIVLGNYLGVALHALIPCAVCMILFFPRSISGFFGVLFLISVRSRLLVTAYSTVVSTTASLLSLTMTLSVLSVSASLWDLCTTRLTSQVSRLASPYFLRAHRKLLYSTQLST